MARILVSKPALMPRKPRGRIILTFIIAFVTRKSSWLVADRRLSKSGEEPDDTGIKVMALETNDAVSLIGYSGLGATGAGTQPSDWMVGVLSDMNLPLEQSLSVIAGAIEVRFPKHLLQLPSQQRVHETAVVSLMRDGNDSRICVHKTDYNAGRSGALNQFSREDIKVGDSLHFASKFYVGGAGRKELLGNTVWARKIAKLVAACEREKITDEQVAREFSRINFAVHEGHKETVGPECIVVTRRKGGGGNHGAYLNGDRLSVSVQIPTVVTFIGDMNAFLQGEFPGIIGLDGQLDLEAMRRLMESGELTNRKPGPTAYQPAPPSNKLR
jgi:hypothetical protein